MIPKEANTLRPRAFEYYDFFSSLTPASGWSRVNLLADARRGDLIAWRFPQIEKGHDTGHVVFVAEAPIAAGAGIWSVMVYDSAAYPHFDDTRVNDDGRFQPGTGLGTINFKTDGAGSPVSFQFGPTEDSFVTLPIAIGSVDQTV